MPPFPPLSRFVPKLHSIAFNRRTNLSNPHTSWEIPGDCYCISSLASVRETHDLKSVVFSIIQWLPSG